MRLSNIYIFGNSVVDEDCHTVYMHLIKLLYRLEIIDRQLAVDTALNFRTLVV
jgi:hypothetical protein